MRFLMQILCPHDAVTYLGFVQRATGRHLQAFCWRCGRVETATHPMGTPVEIIGK